MLKTHVFLHCFLKPCYTVPVPQNSSRKIQALIEHYQKAHNQTFKDEKAGPLTDTYCRYTTNLFACVFAEGRTKLTMGYIEEAAETRKNDLKLPPRIPPTKNVRREEDREGNRRRKGSGGEGTMKH